MKKQSPFIAWMTVLSTLVMITVNALATILPINGITTAEISDSYFDLFAPTGLTFAIWGLIYLLLLGYTGYQWVASQKSSSSNFDFGFLNRWFIIANLVNAIWIFAWHYDLIGVSLVLMLFLLGCLIAINLFLTTQQIAHNEKRWITLPFRIYLGWITVATIANVTTWLVSIGFDGMGIAPEIWTALILIVGVIISGYTMWFFRSVAYGLVIVWAYFGIYLKHTSAVEFNNAYPLVIYTVIAMMVVLVLEGLWVLKLSKD